MAGFQVIYGPEISDISLLIFHDTEFQTSMFAKRGFQSSPMLAEGRLMLVRNNKRNQAAADDAKNDEIST